MATRTETLTGRLAVDTSAWRGGLAQASTMFKGFASNVGRGLTGAFTGAVSSIKGVISGIGGFISSTIGGALQALGIGGLLSAGGILAGIKNITDLGGELSDVSARTGIAVDQLLILREQFRQGGIEASSVTQYIRRMNEALSDTKKQDLIQALGLDSGQLLKDGPVASLNAILEKVRQIKGTANQQKALSNIFGARQGVELMTLVNDKESEANAKKMLGKLPELMKKNAEEMDDVSDNLFEGIPVKLQQAFAGFTEQILGPLKKITDWVESADFTAVGQRLGAQLMWAKDLFSQMWTDGTLIEFFAKSLVNAIIMAASVAAAVFSQAFKALFSTENIEIAKGAINGLMMYLGGAMQEAMANALDSMPMLRTLTGANTNQMREDAALKKQEGNITLDNNAAMMPQALAATTEDFLTGLRNWDVLATFKPFSDSLKADLQALQQEAAKNAKISAQSPVQQAGGWMASLTPDMQPGTVQPGTKRMGAFWDGATGQVVEREIPEALKKSEQNTVNMVKLLEAIKSNTAVLDDLIPQ